MLINSNRFTAINHKKKGSTFCGLKKKNGLIEVEKVLKLKLKNSDQQRSAVE